MANISDVAKRAGVSAMTVSRVLNSSGYVKTETRKRVVRAMEDLNYIPSGLARSLIQQRTYTLALVVPDITNPFFTTVARGMEDVARKNGYRVVLTNTDEDTNKETEYVHMCATIRADGVLIAPTGDASVVNLQLLSQQSIPFVLIDREVGGLEADLVKGDMVGAARQLIEHLIELGHHRIAAITGPRNNAASRDRLQGYQWALTQHHLPLADELIKEAVMTRQVDGRFVAELLALPDPPTAIFTANNFQCARALASLRQLGQRVPEDISIVSFDNSDPLCIMEPFITAAIQPAYDFGSLGTQLLLERIEGIHTAPQRIVLEASIVHRKSTQRR
ncbi:LacI family transcriptional regulator [Alicyclobacillaceae bacterium I2511]|nr:LacI family transcriptional regulator [Alicyclobacillaceae bacterium I2511]